MKSLYDLNYEQMQNMALEHGWKAFRGHQIFQWLYRSRVSEIDEMSNLSKETREVLKELIQTKTFVDIGKMYGVSDNAIRKWCKNENLPYRLRDIKLIEDWDNI